MSDRPAIAGWRLAFWAVLWIWVLFATPFTYAVDTPPGGFPTSLLIKDSPPSETDLGAARLSVRGAKLVIVPAAKHLKPLTIGPWPKALASFQCAACRMEFQRRFQPDGPTFWLLARRDNQLILKIGFKTRRSDAILPGWNIREGSALRVPASSGRRWVRLTLSGAGGSQTVEPGRPVRLQSNGQTWVFILIGANVKQPPELSAIPKRPNRESPGAHRAEISDEQPGLIADWILLRKTELP